MNGRVVVAQTCEKWLVISLGSQRSRDGVFG